MSNPVKAAPVSRPAIELFLLSAAVLYFELLIIRWLSADFAAFTVFKTFPLVTCYIGLGLGFAALDGRCFRYAPLAFAGFFAVMRFLESAVHPPFSGWPFPSVGVYQWAHVDLTANAYYIIAFTSALILLLAGPLAIMALTGARLGQLFESFRPLTAYGINLLGSIAGSIVFSLLAFSNAPPWMLLIAPLSLVCLYAPSRWWLRAGAGILAVALAAWSPNSDTKQTVLWSPYQKLLVKDVNFGSAPSQTGWEKDQGVVIAANGQFYQYALDLSQKNLTRPDMPADVRAILQQHANQYNLPYKLLKPKNVLILGAGSGNDVASALRHDIPRIDAVDIDPVIINLGRLKHPEHPYSSSRVNVYCDDARNYLNNCKEKYDLIVFAGLDSHTVTGKGSSVRLDNFVYTKESVQRALSLLNTDGLMVLSFCRSKPWLSKRLFETIKTAAGYCPLVLLDSSKPVLQWEIFLLGNSVQQQKLNVSANLAPFLAHTPEPSDFAHILTDDWPFIYVTPVTVDVPYLFVISVVLLLAVLAARKTLSRGNAGRWQLFFLGAAFILLELQAIARLCLLFGATWMTSSIVINSVLLVIFLANIAVDRFGEGLSARQPLLYTLLFLTLLCSYLLPVNQLLSLQSALGYVLVTAVTVAPMFMAGIVFPVVFSKAGDTRIAYGFNILGAVLGSMLEYVSNFTGINSLVLLALLLYALSLACFVLTGKSSPAQPEVGN